MYTYTKLTVLESELFLASILIGSAQYCNSLVTISLVMFRFDFAVEHCYYSNVLRL